MVRLETGTDLGLSKSASLRLIYVSQKGHIGLFAQGMLALIKYYCPTFRLQIIHHNADVCKIKVWEDYKEDKEFFHIFEYTQKDIKTAGLNNREVHTKYPRQLLWARNISEMARCIYPHIINGMYVPEEVDFFEEPKKLTKIEEKKLEADIVDVKKKVENFIDGEFEEITDDDIKNAEENALTPADKMFETYKKAKSLGMKIDSGTWELQYYNEGIEWTPKNAKDLEIEKPKKKITKKKTSKIAINIDEKNALNSLLSKPNKKTNKKKKSSKSKKNFNNLDDEIMDSYQNLPITKRNLMTFDDYKEVFMSKRESGEL